MFTPIIIGIASFLLGFLVGRHIKRRKIEEFEARVSTIEVSVREFYKHLPRRDKS